MAAEQKNSQETWPTEEDFNQHSEILKWRDLQKRNIQDPWLQGKTKQFWCLSHITIEHKRQCNRI